MMAIFLDKCKILSRYLERALYFAKPLIILMIEFDLLILLMMAKGLVFLRFLHNHSLPHG